MGVAQATGTVQFLAAGLIIIAAWFAINGIVAFAEHTVHQLAHGGQFDPAPWILLNLIFSFEAFFTGSLVIIAARASAIKDEAREEADAKHREALAQSQLELLKQNVDLTEQVHKLSEQIHAFVCTDKQDAPGAAAARSPGRRQGEGSPGRSGPSR